MNNKYMISQFFKEIDRNSSCIGVQYLDYLESVLYLKIRILCLDVFLNL